MSLTRFVSLAALTLIVSAVTTTEAHAQYRGRGYRPVNRWNMAPWMWGVAMANRQSPTIILPPNYGLPGSSTAPGGSRSALPPTATVAIRIVLPVAGATIAVNGVDFGKTEYYERKLEVPEAPDGLSHDYTVSATWLKDGKTVTQERTVKVGKSGKATANFMAPEPPAKTRS
jgi:uncharacterized protein (TIGR03000 family)